MNSPRAYTLVEMLVTVAVLVVVLGLMISLARHVRDRSATLLASDLLSKLEILRDHYHARFGMYPTALAVVPDNDDTDENLIRRRAVKNNQQFIRELRSCEDLSQTVFKDLPISIYNEVDLRDPWGDAIIYLDHPHATIGMPPGDGHFFFSAGPDRKFMTREDNLYSYETTPAERR
jgi:prepilin-type N-terminal cleavage/methylation domain-containing protein